MIRPSSTYRIQFTKDFTFDQAVALVPRLHRFGITHIYASPIFAARPGSQHGYDVVDPTRVNEELGGREGLERLVAALRAHQMGLVLDIVPNHMAASADNLWWMDVLENGASSRYASFFSINWSAPAPNAEAKIVLPVLGDLYGKVLERGELKIGYEARGFFVSYYAHKFRLGPGTYEQILRLQPELPDVPEFLSLVERFERLPPRNAAYWEAIEVRQTEINNFKAALWQFYENDSAVHQLIDSNVAVINNDRARLHRLLEAQAYRLAWWRIANERINYRRFFDVNELVGVRIDDSAAFAETHRLILELVDQNHVDGLRVDHIDGLADPAAYLEQLPSDKVYVVVEKILADREVLPHGWKTAGTSGYDFLGFVNSVLTSEAGFARLKEIWAAHTGITDSLSDVEYNRKRLAIRDLFIGEVENLGTALARLAEMDLMARDLSPHDLTDALIEVTAALSVYRTYTNSQQVSDRDKQYITEAVDEARCRNPKVDEAVWSFLFRTLTLEIAESAKESAEPALQFVMRWQQLTGPIMAKGVEDSTFYVYNPLVSMNEVGSPGRALSISDFHELMRRRSEQEPLAMNGTSTHDTKRSEDARARIAVLSELPEEWARFLKRWSRWLNDRRGDVDANEEYFYFQNLLGVWPLDEADRESLPERLVRYTEKASREARVHTTWLNPNQSHEESLRNFINALLADQRFLADFQRLADKVAFYGAMNSLTQTLLKITCPGVPDFYQGTMEWNFSLVDPDNRRQVELPDPTDFNHSPADLMRDWRSGRIKAYLTESALCFRRAHRDLFEQGTYEPVQAAGRNADNVIAFVRRHQNESMLVVVPRLMTQLSVTQRLPLGIRAWGDTELQLPNDVPSRWRSIFTHSSVTTKDGGLRMSQALERFPVALFSGRS